MKSLTPTLEAAQKARHRRPHVEAVVHDLEQGIKRLYWERLYTGAEPESHHDIAIDGEENMHRIRVEGNTLYRQRESSVFAAAFPHTFPIPLGGIPDLSTWTQVTTDCACPCSIAAWENKVYIFWRQNTVDRLQYIRSHDYGNTWTAIATFRNHTGVLSMAAAWAAWTTARDVCCFALRDDMMTVIVWNTETDSFVRQRDVAFSGLYAHHIIQTFGIGAAWNHREVRVQVVFAGLETDTPYDHYNVYTCQVSPPNHTFSIIRSFIRSAQDPITPELLTHRYPDCHMPLGSQDYENVRFTLVENFTGTAPYKRPLTCHAVKDTSFVDNTCIEPRPFLPVESDYGLRMASNSLYWFLSRPDGFWRARREPLPSVELTPDIVAFTLKSNVIASTDSSGRGNLVVELDNSKGRYAHPGTGPLASLAKRAEIELRLGYITPAGAETEEAGRYWIDSWEYSSEPNRSTFTIYALDGWSLANRWTPGYQLRWNAPTAPTPTPVWNILYQLLGGFGIRLDSGPPRSDPMLNFAPDFTLLPGQRGATAIRRLLAVVPDRLVFLGQTAFVKDPLDTEASSYDYSPDAGEHRILQGRFASAVTASRARAVGREPATGEPIAAEAFRYELLEMYDQLAVVRDPNLESHADALTRAESLLRAASLRAERGNLVVPANVGQELMDVISVTDPRCGMLSERFRVMNMATVYDRRRERYEQTMTLGAP